ncbi:hypothetical protein [Ralstonia phage RSL2]|uniref:Uncharacterized protein n=1 Tax=Ralstonia phage RSL2 TaxID=1585840 RepID=A0A146I5G1_9CAUD|nr:hypothetical protein [Ralstonia phage RSL2]
MEFAHDVLLSEVLKVPKSGTMKSGYAQTAFPANGSVLSQHVQRCVSCQIITT